METINQENVDVDGNNLKEEKTTKLTALVVDDDAITRRIHQAHLNKRGFATTTVENGKEAVDLYADGNNFDLIIMDMEMPVMNGIRATTQLREMGVKSLIIGASASMFETDIENFKKAGLDEFHVKPISAAAYDAMPQSARTVKKD